jgi:hypothetical protein
MKKLFQVSEPWAKMCVCEISKCYSWALFGANIVTTSRLDREGPGGADHRGHNICTFINTPQDALKCGESTEY